MVGTHWVADHQSFHAKNSTSVQPAWHDELMLAAYANAFNATDPIAGLIVGDRPEPEESAQTVTLDVTAAALNHHDIWSLRGVGLTEAQLPMTLGCDAVGIVATKDHPWYGRRALVYPVISNRVGTSEDETLDPKRTLLSEAWQGTLAERVSVPRDNLVAIPETMSDAAAACLPTAYLTAYRMLFTQAQVTSESRVLIQGARGGVSIAATQLALAAGCTVYVTGRDPEGRERIAQLSSNNNQAAVLETGARLPERVDVVIESVGEATWGHSLKALKPGGCIVICGATSGAQPPADLQRVFFLQLRVLGSTMGTRDELAALVDYMAAHNIEPIIDSTYSLAAAAEALHKLEQGAAFGKIVLVPGPR